MLRSRAKQPKLMSHPMRDSNVWTFGYPPRSVTATLDNCHSEKTNAPKHRQMFSHLSFSNQNICENLWHTQDSEIWPKSELQSPTDSNWSRLLIKVLSANFLLSAFEKDKKVFWWHIRDAYSVDAHRLTAARKGLRCYAWASARLDVRMCMCK